MSASILLLLLLDNDKKPNPPVGLFYWIDNLGNYFVTNTGTYIAFNPGS